MKAQEPEYDPSRHIENQRGARYFDGRHFLGYVVAQSDRGVYVSSGYNNSFNVHTHIEYYVTQKKATSRS